MAQTIKEKIRNLADEYALILEKKMAERVFEMSSDDNSHHLIYQVLGVRETEGELIDIYQNKGRFLYKYAGAFLEKATILCFSEMFPEAKKFYVENTIGKRPKNFEIDCLIFNEAIEIKWRDATTDGDHITKEHTRIRVIKDFGFKPIRLMFYLPNREQARRIQAALKTLYDGIGGEYYAGQAVWDYLQSRTEINLQQILFEIVEERLQNE